MGLPHVRFAIKRVKDLMLDFGKAAMSLVNLSFRWWVIDHEKRSFRDDGPARLDHGSRSKTHTLFIDSRLADATFENWLDWVGDCGSKTGDVVFGR